jgi:large subunit ribosomal protein L15
MRPGFEGGQLPLIKRLPRKRGFTNVFRREYSIIGLEKLATFKADSQVTPEELLKAGLVKSLNKPIKILAGGEIKIPLKIKADKFSKAARQRIEAVGGTVEETGNATEAD